MALDVLTEAGYRCGVPNCRGILALDLHHLVPIRDGGPNTAANLIALCPTCHALFERGTIPRESVFAWKAYLRSLSHAYDHSALDLLW
ncbi:MAG: HNH endonuclease signature motif containing protein, partial [bacterium]